MAARTYTVRTTDDRSLCVSEGGAKAGPVVFYLHGTPLSGRLYGPHEEDAQRRGLRLVGYDRPGYGGSTPRPGRTISDAAADVVAIADHLGVERFGVWGISGGGPHALACAALIPRRAIAVAALASPAPYPAEGLNWLASTGEANVAEFQASMKGTEATEAFLAPLRAAYMGPDPRAVDAGMESLLTPADRAAYAGPLRTFLYESGRYGLAPGVAGWRDDDIAFVRPWGFDVAGIRIPITIWQGRQDLFVPYAHGKWLAEHIPHAVQNLSDEDGHLTLYQRRVPQVHSWLATYIRR
jgi:pimeloyl-ACP methyl ester carboxylesterase